MKERKLGRGLSDLITENVFDVDTEEVVKEIPVHEIKPNPDQPRTHFNNEAIKELSDSIKEHGIIQPIIVKPTAGVYTLVAGERRLRAAKMIGLDTVPCIVRDYNAIYLAELAILENLQREDLNPIEEAIALQKIIFTYGITHEELGKKIGKSRVYVTNALGLLKLPGMVLDALVERKITAGHARALSKIKEHNLVVSLFNKVLEEELSVRELESLIRDLSKKESLFSKHFIQAKNRELKQLFDKNYKVKVSNKSVSFYFKTQEDFDKIMMLLKKIKD